VSERITDDFRVLGELDFESAELYNQRGLELINRAGERVEVDLAALARANSVTVAVLLSWRRHATVNGKSIVFVNLSSDLRKIIDFSGLSSVLPGAGD
jgi:anti-anti-sigma factor